MTFILKLRLFSKGKETPYYYWLSSTSGKFDDKIAQNEDANNELRKKQPNKNLDICKTIW